MTQTAKLTASDGAATTFRLLGFDQRQHGGGRRDVPRSAATATRGRPTCSRSRPVASMTQTAKLTASDGAADDYFGASVSISGNTVVVGADATVGSNTPRGRPTCSRSPPPVGRT